MLLLQILSILSVNTSHLKNYFLSLQGRQEVVGKHVKDPALKIGRDICRVKCGSAVAQLSQLSLSLWNWKLRRKLCYFYLRGLLSLPPRSLLADSQTA